jgi:peptidase M60-like protein/type IX secretion system substrate protein/enhancin-like peptidase M60 family
MRSTIIHIYRPLLYLLLLFLILPDLKSQVASYNFNSNVEDQLGAHHASVFGSPTFENGEYIAFNPGEYLTLPLSLSESIDVSESWQVQFRFKVEGDWRATEGEEAQVILSNKRYDQREGGFDITAREWGGQLQIITTFGDGVVYEPGACASCCTVCTESEGKLDWVMDIDSDIWYDVKIKFVFTSERPYIQYEINGTVAVSFFNLEDPKADPQGFRQTINQQQFWVGTSKDNGIFIHSTNHPKMDLQIDELSFYSPVPAGDADEVGIALQALVDEMNGVTNLSEVEVQTLRKNFVDNWDDESYGENEAVIWSYIDAYAENNEPIFSTWDNVENPQDFTPTEAIQFIIEQWILDNRYGPETVSEMEGLVFEDHELFPGKVSSVAPRVEGATFTINGDYQTIEGFLLNGQEVVIRPTGYYVPSGELITITVPDEAIGKGLSLFVGAHNTDLTSTWSRFRRFPRIMTTYEVDSKTIIVANPFGGGIYVNVPDGSSLGALEFQVDGAIKAPYYSTQEGFSNSLEEFKVAITNQYVPWVDIESPNMMTTVTHGMAATAVDFDSIISVWNKSFDAVNIALGRPVERFRGEYFLIDRQNHSAGTAIPAGYPMSFERLDEPYGATVDMPLEVEEGRDWYRAKEANFHNIIFHEQGHLHNMPTMLHEQESNVNLLAAAVYSIALGESIDSALVYSNQQKLNLDQAALDWVLIDNFYLGNRIGYRVESQERSGDEQSYQSRGYAKYVDIANLFGWEALGSTFSPFYERKREDPSWDPYGLEDDEYIEAASIALGFNMAPHFEFWGIIPSADLVERLSDMPTSDIIKDRLIHFRSIVPADNEEFQALHSIMTSKLEPHHRVRYDEWKTSYDETFAKRVTDRIDEILNKYYEIDVLDYNVNPVITGLSETLYVTVNNSFTLTLDKLIVEDIDNDYPDDFTLSLMDGDNYSVILTSVTPNTDFLGELTVPVIVNDGLEDSEQFLLKTNVIPENDRPVITGVAEVPGGDGSNSNQLTTFEDVPLELTLSNFEVEDNDNTYPDDFMLIVGEGEHYTVSGTVITPDLNYFGKINVPVKVNDGLQDSNEFIAEIDIVSLNDSPVVLGQARLFSSNEDEPIFFRADDFAVEDVDNEPGDYFVQVLESTNYSVEDNSVTPSENFSGQLTITMIANDGMSESDPYEFKIEVQPVNDKPVINGLAQEGDGGSGSVSALRTEIDTPITLTLPDFDVFDPDNTYPDDFTLTVLEGSDFSVSATIVTPAPSFTGELSVPVIVNDGQIDSEQYVLKINVIPPNDQPVITGIASPLSTLEDTPVGLNLSDFNVTDGNHSYPDDFILSVLDGDHYTVNEITITPEVDFFGELSVPIKVNDGVEDSELFVAKIDVISVNDAPVINGLVAGDGSSPELSIEEDTPITLALSDFVVQDPDNTYPEDFTLTILDGNNYLVNGLVITPEENFNGDLSVPVIVNDGSIDSEEFMVSIGVTPINDLPIITGLVEALATGEETPITLSLTDFVVEDPDNNFPDDFKLMVLDGENYSVTATIVSPDPDFVGTLSVPVNIGDGIGVSQEFLTSIEVTPVLGVDDSFVKMHFTLNPNPTTGKVNIIKDQNVPIYHMKIFSIKGELIKSLESITDHEKQIDLSNRSKGLYILQIISPNGVDSFKVIKR